ncbi:MAG: LacI family DNA-binding transcriptional regulator [Lentisphaeria bacterium]
MRRKRSITVTDVAREAGVSQATVSAALHGRGRVGAARRAQVVAVARRLGYEPRVAAQLLRARKTGQLGVVVAAQDSVSAFRREVQRRVVGYFVDQCAARGIRYQIEFHHHTMDDGGGFIPPHQVVSKLVDGTLLVGDVGEPLRQWLAARGDVPWVSIEEPAAYCVLSAADKAVYQAVAWLAELGHRRFAYGGGPERYSQNRLGQEGLRRAAGEFGLRHEEQLFSGEMDAARAEASMAWARGLLARPRPERPTAFICHGESLARAVVHAAAEKGLAAPADLSVVSYGSEAEAAARYPKLTTIENDYAAVTAQAMEMLLARVQGRPVEQPVQWVLPRLVVGATTNLAPVTD